MPSSFCNKLATIAQQQYQKYKHVREGNLDLCKQIQKYWTELGLEFKSCTSDNYPWSAVFISWCVKQAGATSLEFQFSSQHSVFVKKAIKNALDNTGTFKGRNIKDYAPKIGDIIQNNRAGNTYNFEFAKANGDYKSHTAIVVEVGQDVKGKYCLTIGGNENDTVGMKEIRLNTNGKIIQQISNPYICIIENLK